MPRGINRGLKLLQLILRTLQAIAALVVLAITAYALASSGDDSAYTDSRHYSVIGIAVVALVYAIVALVCRIYLLPRMWLALIFIVFDLAFVGTSIFTAVVHGDGARNCDGSLPRSVTRVACQLQKAVMATAIASVLLFVLSIPTEVWTVRLQLRERRINPDAKLDGSSILGDTPDQGGRTGGFFSNVFRRNTTKTVRSDNVLPTHTLPQELDHTRPSYGTDTTFVNHDDDDVDDHIYPDPNHPSNYHKYYLGGNGYQHLHPNRQTPQHGNQPPM
ncbi:hypothetical protein S40285_04240 [Stachybotrys chlorohalonatus IBT 40285]|uniref:MARVEL domain-containing protein n=1 Tax=Stachybotrys chlorohalonatus (strain IBT 40285) TaxID=1283841 RepID=A0A084QUB4_STAC4|nr:hypothetical protein S40285_04240 [Stachybotrys chlorohalonata IBT 40285]